jgi:hypothetical protein
MNYVLNYKELFDSYLGDKYVIRGSVAIKLYCDYFGIVNDYEPTDIDITYISKQLIYNKNIGDYVRFQEAPERSLTFINKNTLMLKNYLFF